MKSGWRVRSLGELCQVIGGGTPSKDKAEYYSGGIPWATVRDMRSDVITETEFKITKAAVASSATNIIPSGNVVIATRVGLGKVCLLGQDTAINQDLRGIVPIAPKVLLVRFLFWWLKSVADSIVAEGTGATVQGVRLPFVKALQVPLPSLSEQQRIVAILDDASEAIATARANTEQNLRNAREVFENHLRSVFTEGTRSWERRALGALCSVFVDSPHRTPRYQEEGVAALRPRDVVNGMLDLSGAARVSEGEYETQTKRYKPCAGDIVYSRELSYGWAAVLPSTPRVCLSQGMCVFRSSSHVETAFLLHALNGPVGREQAIGVAVGAAHPHINLSDIRSYLIPVPPLDQQREIAQRLDALAADTKRLEAVHGQKLDALDALKQSLLHQAFAGAL